MRWTTQGLRRRLQALILGEEPAFFVTWAPGASVSDVEAATKVGSGYGADVLMSVIRWIQNAASEARIVVHDEEGQPVAEHPLSALVRQTVPGMSPRVLIDGVIFDLIVTGNAYWGIERTRAGAPAYLVWLPAAMVTPLRDKGSRQAVDGYRYRTGAITINLQPEDVVHMRIGADPRKPWMGLSPLESIAREVFADMDASRFAIAMLRNGGVPGIVLSPASPDVTISPEVAKQIEARMAGLRGEGRGSTLVLSAPISVETVGSVPRNMDLGPLRDISEERVCAALGVPAAVVGFGSGLQQTKVGATMAELRKLAWQTGVIPMLRRIVEAIESSSLSDMLSAGERVGIDTSGVAALREDADSRAKRARELFLAGIISQAEARAMIGLDGGDDIHVLPINILPIGEARPQQPAQQQAARLNHSHDTLLEREVRQRPSYRPPRRVTQLASDILAAMMAREPQMRRDVQDALDAAGEAWVWIGRRALEQAAQQQGAVGARKMGAADDLTRIIIETANDVLERLGEDTITGDIPDRVLHGLRILKDGGALGDAYVRMAKGIGADVARLITGAYVGVTVDVDALVAGLVDLAMARSKITQVTLVQRRWIFDLIREGVADGLSGLPLAERLVGIPRGPWSSTEIRARVVARTEGMLLMNTATLETAAAAGDAFDSVMVLDARAGDTDETCMELDGTITSIAEARSLMEAEHPNGTRQFVPLTPQIREEIEHAGP